MNSKIDTIIFGTFNRKILKTVYLEYNADRNDTLLN